MNGSEKDSLIIGNDRLCSISVVNVKVENRDELILCLGRFEAAIAMELR